MKIRKNIIDICNRLLSFRSNTKIFLIFNFLFFITISDICKAESNNSDFTKNNQLSLEYLNPKNALEDYIIDTGDSLFINFINRPRGLESVEKKLNTNDISYLNQRNNLKNYKLDTDDILGFNFSYIPRFDTTQKINDEGEITLPEIGTIYVRGLNIYELENLLEIKYDEFLKIPDIKVSIEQFRFINSGIYEVNTEGEIILPLLNELYFRGLTTGEISALLSKKLLESEKIYAEIKTKIVGFKRQRILISGEIRNPGIYKFSSFNTSVLSFFDQSKIPLKRDMPETIDNYNNQREFISPDRNSVLGIDTNSIAENSELVSNNNSSSNFQVKRSNDNFTTISNAILAAGGITSSTDLSRIELIRDLPLSKGGGKKKATIDFTPFLENADPTNDLRLFDGDSLIFPKLNEKSEKQISKSVLRGISPKFISLQVFGRVESPGAVLLPFEASLSDAIDVTGPIKPLSGNIVLIRYKKDGTVMKKNISYSAAAKRGSKRNPYVKEGDLITVKNSILSKSTDIIGEITSPFIGIYSTKQVIEGLAD